MFSVHQYRNVLDAGYITNVLFIIADTDVIFFSILFIYTDFNAGYGAIDGSCHIKYTKIQFRNDFLSWDDTNQSIPVTAVRLVAGDSFHIK